MNRTNIRQGGCTRKTVLVTGGSRGIGAATCLAAARDGWRVIVNYRSSLAEAVVALIAAFGGDISQEHDVLAIFAKILARSGGLQGLVKTAGILPRVGRFEDTPLQPWQRTLTVNTIGTFLCCRAAIKMMAPQHAGTGGTSVTLSSMAATLGGPAEFVDYATSKGAIDSLTIGLSKESAPDNIRLNTMRAGLIATDIHASAGDGARLERARLFSDQVDA